MIVRKLPAVGFYTMWTHVKGFVPNSMRYLDTKSYV